MRTRDVDSQPLAIAVEEHLELGQVCGGVEIGPLELAVRAQPLLLAGDLASAVDRTSQVEMVPTGCHVGGYDHL